jgi:hypothetical protein
MGTKWTQCVSDFRSLRMRSITSSLFLIAATFLGQISNCYGQTNAKAGQSAPQRAKAETPHLEFVNEYIRELAAYERIRAGGEEENNQDTKNDKLPFAGGVHTCTLFELELDSDIKMLKRMRLIAPFDDLIPNITAFYEEKVRLWRRMREINSSFLEGPKDGVDYGKLAAEMPEIRGRLEFIDQALFEATPLVFATLIDEKADSKGHASHLIITKEEKNLLISRLNDSFGAKLDEKHQNYIVSSASVLRAYLQKDFKCADEPWE